MRLTRSLNCFRKTILPVCDKIQHVHCVPCFLHLRRFPSHIITSASLTLQTNVFSSEVFMEGGTDNPSAHRNCAGTIPSSVTDPLRSTSCWANIGVEEARLRPRCCRLVLLADDVQNFFGIWISAYILLKSTHSTPSYPFHTFNG